MTSATDLTGEIPAHLPSRLAITLWDFSWYTRAGVGEPFHDLDRAFVEAKERGYNTVRICAATLFLFGDLGLPETLEVSGLGPAPTGGYYGQRTRWYDTPGGYSVDLRARLLELFAGARKHGFVVILATWEYQQSPSFSADSTWWDAIDAIPLAERYEALASASSAMLTFLEQHGMADLVAFTELHNEVDFSRVPALTDGGAEAIDRVSAEHPGQLVTASYGKPPHLDMESSSPAMQVAQFHVYTYGVLDALQSRIDLRSEGTVGFPNDELRGLLRADAPTFEQYGRPERWRLDATVITDQMIYGYDWLDMERWDLWLYDHYGEYREAMHQEIAARVIGVTSWARRHGVPTVVGEGWIGYTPLEGGFEEGPVGKDLAEHGIRTALANGVWGMVLCSNAAPHHPMWADVAWQRRMNAVILDGAN